MRRLTGPVLVGLGVFLIVAAALLRFYAYPTLAKVPHGYNSETFLEATDAQIFNSDPEVLAPEVQDLAITSKTSEDVEADTSEGDVVWVNVNTIDKVGGGNFQKSTERVAFDEVTGAAVECEACDTFVEVDNDGVVERVPTTFEGQVYKFPFDTQKQDYDQWDGTLGEAFPAEYEGEEEIQGVTVYKFVQRIEPTVVETRDVPGKVFGSDEPTVQAELVYAMTRTFYIEPATGSPLDRVEERTQELAYDGVTVPAFVGTVQYTDAQVDELVDDVSLKASLLGGMRLLFPLLMLVVGLVALAAGLWINRRQNHHPVAADQPDRPLVSA